MIRLALVILMTIPSAPQDAEFYRCPSTPNCVSSRESGSRFIEPLRFTGDPQKAFDRLREVLKRRPDTTIVSDDGSKLEVEFRTFLGFVDDGLFVLEAERGIIHLRSAARLGYWDIGKNARRIEEIRREFDH